jgi:DNA polymerase-1
MSGAELRIIGNLSGDPVFKECFINGIDLHTRSASEIFKVSMSEVDKNMRNSCKALSFGLLYGLSKFGLSKRLKITEKAAKELIENYFSIFKHIKKYLDESARSALLNGYSRSISGRKRYYSKPENGNPDKSKIIASIRRRAMNAPIQSGNADTIKQAMIYCVEKLKKSNCEARLILTVHDEIVIETKTEQKYEVAKLIEESIVNGFGHFFTDIPMETEACIGPCWLKNPCDCGHPEMKFIPDKKYGTKLVCAKCGKGQ